MFEPKSLKQAYTLARLHDKTLTHKHYSSNPNKQIYHSTTYTYQNKNYPLTSYDKCLPTHPNNITKPIHTSILSTPIYNPTNTTRTTRPMGNKDLNERRAKGLYFWCDEKFVPKHKFKNKKLYSLCVIEEEEEGSKEEGVTEIEIDTHNSIYFLML
jgi:hypothetical protein